MLGMEMKGSSRLRERVAAALHSHGVASNSSFSLLLGVSKNFDYQVFSREMIQIS